MKCPECKQPMVERSFEGHQGQPVAVDVCHGCRGLWFDAHESLQLSAQGTLRLFREMHGHRAERRPHAPGPRACPRCDAQLRTAQDMARNQRFQSSRCIHGHGHFITFFQFLREKGIVRDLRPQEHLELRKHVDTLRCSDCGEPVRLATLTACMRCHAPLSLMDPACVESTVRDAQRAAGSRQDVAPEVAAQLLMTHAKLKSFHPRTAPHAASLPLVSLAAPPADSSPGWGGDLIEAGLELIVEVLETVGGHFH